MFVQVKLTHPCRRADSISRGSDPEGGYGFCKCEAQDLVQGRWLWYFWSSVSQLDCIYASATTRLKPSLLLVWHLCGPSAICVWQDVSCVSWYMLTELAKHLIYVKICWPQWSYQDLPLAWYMFHTIFVLPSQRTGTHLVYYKKDIH